MSNVCPAAATAPFRNSRYRLGLRPISFALVCITVQLAAPGIVRSQAGVGGRNEVFAGSNLESYLRYLQTVGESRAYPWTIRAFSPSEIDALTAKDTLHPWAQRYDLQQHSRASGLQWDYIRPNLTFYLNSTFAYGGNDGAVWQGKGLTTALQGGISARWGPFSAVIAPVAFRAENQSFILMNNGETGRLQFGDGQWVTYIDKPQRFGVDPYSQADIGQSELRVDTRGFAAGISTANQWWGPADRYPYVLGNNAAGFPHVFLGTSDPWNLWIAKVHGRLVYGTLDQSAYSPVTGPKYFTSFSQPGRRRFMAGIVGTIQPRGAPGLEIGGVRFFEAADSNGISRHNLELPLQGFLKAGLKKESDIPIQGGFAALKENQLASVFVRWAPPGSGFEVWMEFGRDDHSLDDRDLILEPDHSAATNFGFRKAWLSPTVMHAIRGEVFTYEASAGSRTRAEGQSFIHGILRQGHTERGQMLGSNVGPGAGAAQFFAYDRFSTGGSFTAFVNREVQHELRFPNVYNRGPALPRAVDVLNSIGVEATRFIGPFDVMGRATFTADLNRYFRADQSNGNFILGLRQNF